jgi:hypothetical protein
MPTNCRRTNDPSVARVPVLTKEINLERRLRRHLRAGGYAVQKRIKAHGPDIVATKDSQTLYVETIGNQKPSGDPLTSSQKYTHFLRMLGQIVLRLNQPEYRGGNFAIGIPQDSYYCRKLELILPTFRKLRVKVYVCTRGHVNEL